jgi:ABC-type transport system involved in multi-copper enzyme maturation permease subunit
MARWGLGPVFRYECVTAARRWQTYAGRVAFLAVLLVSLGVVWAVKVAPDPYAVSLSKLAQVGESFFYAIAGTQLALVLLAAPAYTAGAVCLDKARGTLAHMLVTDLSSAEVVLGKLGSRLLPVLSLVLAGLPLMALATLLGGIDPEALLGNFLVTLGVGVAGCSLALALSVWGKRPHEVMLATYAVLAAILLALPAWKMLTAAWAFAPTPAWLEKSNPLWLAFAPYLRPGRVTFDDYLAFVGGCLALSALLTLSAAGTLRRAATRAPARRRGGVLAWRWPSMSPPLDFNPVLWRDLRRRSSRWGRVVWAAYIVIAVGASVLALATRGTPGGTDLAYLVNAFQYSIGLLLVSIASVSRLFEERVRGDLDVLLTTPLTTASIVAGKWWGAFRGALLIVVPLALALAEGSLNTRARAPLWQLALTLAGLMLAYGAAVTSVGLALVTWVRRFAVAVGLSVTINLLVSGGSLLVLLALGPSGGAVGFVFVSPWVAAGEFTGAIGHSYRVEPGLVELASVWIAFYGIVAMILALVTLLAFDRCMGRVSANGSAKSGRRVLLEAPRA